MTIIIADDDPDDRLIFCEAVREIDPAIACVEVSNGVALMELLERSLHALPDVLFLDIGMPIMDGKSCLYQIKVSTVLKGIPVVMYSGRSSDADMDYCRKLGARGLIAKPSSYPELLDSIRALIPE